MDNYFLTILEKIPAEDWLRNLPENRIIMLLKTSKIIIDAISKIRPKTYIQLNRSWWNAEEGHIKKKKIIENGLGRLKTVCRIVKLEITNCQMGNNDSNNLYEILIQCNEIRDLDLRMNFLELKHVKILLKQ